MLNAPITQLLRCNKGGASGYYFDFDAFVDLMLAYGNLREPTALAYFFPVLDIQKRSCLTREDLLRFVRSTSAVVLQEFGQETAPEDIADELFDLVKPHEPGYITKKDLVQCTSTRIFIPFMIDAVAMAHLDSGGTF